jgi:hypothetical protein
MAITKKTVWPDDPIVEEIRRHWEEYSETFDHDLDKIYLDLQRRQQETPGRVVSFVRDASTATSPPTAPARPSKRRGT